MHRLYHGCFWNFCPKSIRDKSQFLALSTLKYFFGQKSQKVPMVLSVHAQYSIQLQSFNEFFPSHFREINNLIRKADFNNDPYVKEFGLNISHNLMEVRGRVLPPPKIQYGGECSILWKYYFL